MQIVAIGKPLFEGRIELPEAIEYNYQSGDHTLLLSMKNLHPKEIEAVREAEPNSGFTAKTPLFFCCIVSAMRCRGPIPPSRGGMWRRKTAEFLRRRKIRRRASCSKSF